MTLEKRTDELGTYYHCIGEGQCVCKECSKDGFNRHWTSFCYKLNENDDYVLCRKHLVEKLKEEKKNEH